MIGQASSTSRKVSVGVPQGSILGPLLFAIYINDLPKVLRNTTVTLFADDTALYCSSQSARDLQTMLNQDLDRLAQWLYKHKLTLNVSKSKFMLMGGPRKLNTLEEFTLLYLPTQIRFLIGGERVTCHWSKLSNVLGQQHRGLELLTRT